MICQKKNNNKAVRYSVEGDYGVSVVFCFSWQWIGYSDVVVLSVLVFRVVTLCGGSAALKMEVVCPS
jgi:hypothetical protein